VLTDGGYTSKERLDHRKNLEPQREIPEQVVDRLYVALSDSCTLVRRRRSGKRTHGRRIGSRGEKKKQRA
jgi:hypothetical protein